MAGCASYKTSSRPRPVVALRPSGAAYNLLHRATGAAPLLLFTARHGAAVGQTHSSIDCTLTTTRDTSSAQHPACCRPSAGHCGAAAASGRSRGGCCCCCFCCCCCGDQRLLYASECTRGVSVYWYWDLIVPGQPDNVMIVMLCDRRTLCCKYTPHLTN